MPLPRLLRASTASHLAYISRHAGGRLRAASMRLPILALGSRHAISCATLLGDDYS